MVAVSPVSSNLQLAQYSIKKKIQIFKTSAEWIRWISGLLPGEYTIAKLDAFDQFRQHTPPTRVIAILLVTPIPCLFTSLVIECIPLADSATGFSGSLHFQIRNYLTATIMTAMPVFMKFKCIPALSSKSWRFALGYALTTGAIAIGNNALISLTARVFPIPFTQFAPTIPMAMAGLLLNRFLLQNPETKERAEKIDQWIIMDMIPICVYPIFTAVFMAVGSNQQLWLSLLLPVIKHVLKHIIWLALRDDLDLVGPTMCSVGHLYHVLFTAVCLQNAKSSGILAAVVMVNIFQMVLNCRSILKESDEVKRAYALLCDVPGSDLGDVVSIILDLSHHENVAKLLHRKLPSRIFSKYPGYHDHNFVTRYINLVKTEKPARNINPLTIIRRNVSESNIRGGSRHRSLSNVTKSLSKLAPTPIEQGFEQIIPLTGKQNQCSGELLMVKSNDLNGSQALPVIQPKIDRIRQNEAYVRSVTSALHQTEIILLRSYITIFVLSFYGIYLILIFWLPNRRYFATMATMTTFAAVHSMLFHLCLLASIEIFFLVMYLVLISHRLGVSGIHQLAFVLWSQRVILQSKFLSLSIMILGFPLKHYGNGIIYNLRTA